MSIRRQARRFTPALAASAKILFVALIGSTTLYAQIGGPAPVATIADATPPPRPAPAVGAAGVATPVSLLVGRSTLIDLGTPIARVSLTSADIADAMVTSPSQLLLHGKVPGSISMLIWSRAGDVMRYEVAVQRDLTRLTEQVKELFPAERIQVHSNGRQIVLSGTASSQDVMDKAKNLASGFVERSEDVVLLLQLQQARSNQVLLRVRFAEVSRNALTELGAAFFTSPTGVRNTVGRLTTQQFPAPNFTELEWTKVGGGRNFGTPVESASGKFEFSDFLNLFLLSERYDLGLLVRALQNQGLFQSLAEPNLVAESGKEASFLAGGEFPVPVAQGSGANASIAVQFKEFGIRLSFTPIVDGDRVHLKVRPEVSTLDYANAVQLEGFRIPALTTRRTETELELRDGQTFAIAGLINNQMNSTLSKIPGIGDIPILGYLFKSKAAQKGQTELVVMITPEILPVGSSGVTPNLPRIQEPWLPTPPDNRLMPQPSAPFLPGRNQLTMPEPTPPPARTEAEATPAPSAQAVTPVPAPFVTPPPSASERAAQERAAAQRAAEDARQQQVLAAQQGREAQALAREQARVAKAEAERAKKEAERQQKADAEREKREAELARKEAAQARKDAEREQRAVADRLRKEAEQAARQQEIAARQQKEEQARLEKEAKEQAKRDAEAAREKAEAERRAAEEAKREAAREAERQQEVAAAEAKLRAAFAEYQSKVGKSAAQ